MKISAYLIIILTTTISCDAIAWSSWLTSQETPKYKLIDSSDNNQFYGYAPSIFDDNGTYHMYFCSAGGVGSMDYVRYSTSRDGKIWSPSAVVLSASNPTHERAACDPSVVHYDSGDGSYYYLFYSGATQSGGTTMFVARSTNPGGPFAKWTNQNGGTWVINAPSPTAIINTQHPTGAPFYGAGQQSVVVKQGVLHSWHFDDTANYPNQVARIYHTQTTNPTQWTIPVATNMAWSSPDIKYDEASNKFVMIGIPFMLTKRAKLSRVTSDDGITWSNPSIICDTGCFPEYAHNVGLSGTKQGKISSGIALVAFGAPYELAETYTDDCTLAYPCWGYWDIYGGPLNPGMSIGWGWQWLGMSSAHKVILGDFDGDRKTDRGIVDQSTGRWYIVGTASSNGQTYIPWGWQWPGGVGVGANFEIALGDYDGDGITDRGFINRQTSQWYIIQSSNGAAPVNRPHGWYWPGMNSTHYIASADYDGDGKTDISIVDKNAGLWFVIGSLLPDGGIPWGFHWPEMNSASELVVGDYDGDGKSDRAIVDRSTNRWYVKGSSVTDGGIPYGSQWSEMNAFSKLLTGDYDRDGRTDRAFVDSTNGKWYIKLTSTSAPPADVPYGSQWTEHYSTSQYLAADFDGDGKADRGSVTRADSKWYIVPSSTVSLNSTNKFTKEMSLVLGDYDGDGKTDRGIFDRSDGKWYIYSSLTGNQSLLIPWGSQISAVISKPKLAMGDYNGDGLLDRGLVDPSTGRWYLSLTGSGLAPSNIPYGWQWPGGWNPEYEIVPGDYDGDGITDRAVVNRTTSQWYVLTSSGGSSNIPWGWTWGGVDGNFDFLSATDLDLDGITDRIAVNRATRRWYTIGSSVANPFNWGWQWTTMTPKSFILLADFDGDSIADRTYLDMTTGKWYVVNASGANGVPGISYGWYWPGMSRVHIPAVGDYDGDGRADRAIVDIRTNQWFVIGSSGGNGAGGIPWGWAWPQIP